MPEKFTLSSPQSITDFDIVRFDQQWRDQRIVVEFSDNTGKIITAIWEGTQARNLMIALNKANLSTGPSASLRSRIFQQAATDGKLPAGSITGTPD